MNPTTHPTCGNTSFAAHTPPSSKTASIRYPCSACSEEGFLSQKCDRDSCPNLAGPSQGQIVHDENDQRCGHRTQLSPTPESVSTSFLAREARSSASSTQDDPKAIATDQIRVTVPEDETADGQTRLKGIRGLREAIDKITEIKVEMDKTVFEYFNRRVVVNLCKLKAFTPLCDAIECLIATLDRLIKSLVDGEYFADFKDANYLMYQLKPGLLFMLRRGEQILNSKNKQDTSQSGGESWTKSVRKLHRVLIRDSNDQLENWTRTIKFLEIDIIEKHSHWEPSVGQHLKLEKSFVWLKYTTLKGKIFGATEGPPLPLSQYPSPSMLLHD